VPAVFDSGRASTMETALRRSRPRPMKRARSVSNCRPPTLIPSSELTWAIQSFGSAGSGCGGSRAARRFPRRTPSARRVWRKPDAPSRHRPAPAPLPCRSSIRFRVRGCPNWSRYPADLRIVFGGHEKFCGSQDRTVRRVISARSSKNARRTYPVHARPVDIRPTRPGRSPHPAGRYSFPGIAGRVFAPPRHGNVAPAAVAGAGRGQHERIVAV